MVLDKLGDSLKATLQKIAKSMFVDEKLLNELEKEFTSEIAAKGENHLSISLMKNLAHLEAFYLGKTEEAIDILNSAIDLHDISFHQVPRQMLGAREDSDL